MRKRKWREKGHRFRQAFQILDQNRNTPDVVVTLQMMPGQTSTVYAAPTSDEVAAILPGDGTALQRRDILLRLRSPENSLARIDDGDPAYAPLHYVLLMERTGGIEISGI